jgi:hypothetical protein
VLDALRGLSAVKYSGLHQLLVFCNLNIKKNKYNIENACKKKVVRGGMLPIPMLLKRFPIK